MWRDELNKVIAETKAAEPRFLGCFVEQNGDRLHYLFQIKNKAGNATQIGVEGIDRATVDSVEAIKAEFARTLNYVLERSGSFR